MGLFDWLRGGKTLYFPGKFTIDKLPEIYQNYLEILKILGVDFITLDNLGDSGMSYIHDGDWKNARLIALKNYEIFKKNKVDRIITNSPDCYRMFLEFYPKFIRDFNIKVEHVAVTVFNSLQRMGATSIERNSIKEVVTYKDSCYLGRLFGIYEEPRTVIETLGGKIIEFEKNRENSVCSGACGGVYENFPEIARASAIKTVSKIPREANKIICLSDVGYSNLKDVSEKATEFSTFVLGKLKEVKNF